MYAQLPSNNSITTDLGRRLDNVLDNDQLQVDFKPLYECIHIYSALDLLDEIRRSYQADRKVKSGPLVCQTIG